MCIRDSHFTKESPNQFKEFKDLTLEINPKKDTSKVFIQEEDLGFGDIFSEHMLTIDYSDENGWEQAKIGPLEPFKIHPANSTLHYALTCYEGKFIKSEKLKKLKIRYESI